MIRYVLMIEKMLDVCLNDPPCSRTCNCEHEQRVDTYWDTGRTISAKPGPVHVALARVLGHKHNDETGNAYVAVVDTDTFKPLYNEAESAAFRLGGHVAVKRMQRGIAKELAGQQRLAAIRDKAMDLKLKQCKKRA